MAITKAPLSKSSPSKPSISKTSGSNGGSSTLITKSTTTSSPLIGVGSKSATASSPPRAIKATTTTSRTTTSSPTNTKATNVTSKATSSTVTSKATTKTGSPSKSTIVTKPVATTITKPKTPLPKAPPSQDDMNRMFCKLPSEVLLKVLEFYGGTSDQSCGSNRRKFIQMYFGKFTRSGQRDDTPYFLFRKLELDGTKLYHRSELLRMAQCLGANGSKVAMKAPFSKLLYDTTITDSQQALAQTKKTLKVLPIESITSLNVRQNQLPPEALKLCMEALAPNLEDLTIFQDSGEQYELSMFSKLKFPKLRILRWRGYHLGKDGGKEEDFTEFSINAPSLTTLDIQTSITSIFRFANAIKNWPNLRTVKSILKGENGGSMHGYATLYDSPPEKVQREFFENLSACSKLITLSLDHEKIYPGMLKHLAGMSIRTVEITSCGIGDSFSEILTIGSLKKLKLGTYEAVHEVSMDCLCDLTELNIFRTPTFSVERLSTFKNMKSLALIDQNINDKYVDALSKQLPLLENIDLSSNPITNNSITNLVSNCPNIVSIRAINTGVSQMSLPKEIRYLVEK